MNLGQQVKTLRNKLGLTQKQFGAALIPPTDFTYIGKIKRNQQYPSIKMLERMGRAFNKPLSFWFEGNTRVFSKLVHTRAIRMRAVACLFGKYCWNEGRFSTCPVTCEMQDGLCGAVKALVTTKEIYLERKRQNDPSA